MPYSDYGKIFREIRTQKQLPLSYFESVGVDKSDLSKFERGFRMIGFERVVALLQHMNVSLSEYELILNNFVLDFQEAFLNEVEKADFNQEVNKLKNLYDEAYISGHGLLACAVKARFEELTEKEINFVLDSLNNVTVWGYFELSILYFVLDNLSTKEMRSLFYKFEEKTQNYHGIPKYSRRILQIAFQSVIVLSSKGEKEFVSQILELTKGRGKSGIDIYIENLRKLALGVNHYYFVNQREGSKKIKKSLKIFSFLGHDELAQYYRARIEYFKRHK
ncbi:helix-turn-helix domain-containing protein [Lactococcus garvieae]|uniref:helix-turn-helix domain-containing protein n=1 Tax=Lactococcus garvieae TaxID=1363 RepID=UPI0009BF427F|nr:Rgg/GadR/MutR family transcriptional regulator [Lactococcus garvieae]